MNRSQDPRRFLSLSVRFHGLLDLVVSLAVAGTWIGLGSRWWWFLDLFSHFRLQYLLVCLAALVWLCARKRRVLAAFTALSLAVNAWPVARTTWVRAPESEMDPAWKLKVISFNALFANSRNGEVFDYLRGQNADVIVLLELSPALELALRPLEQSHPHGVRHPDASPWGIGLYSRVPLRDTELRTFGSEEPKSVTALIEHSGKAIRIIGTHPWPPVGRRAHLRMLDQCDAIGRFVAQHREVPTLVVGDFNTTPWSVAMDVLRSHGELDFRTSQPVWLPTWHVGSPLMIPIDHALCTPPLLIAERHIGPDLGSDHRAQELTIQWAVPRDADMGFRRDSAAESTEVQAGPATKPPAGGRDGSRW